MEPRPHERGKRSDASGEMPRRSLQWSHVLTNVERFDGMAYVFGEHVASMEPRPHERGKRVWLIRIQNARDALQWSHVLTNVERN